MELPPEPDPPAPTQQPESSGASSVPAAAMASTARGLRRLWVRMDRSWTYGEIRGALGRERPWGGVMAFTCSRTVSDPDDLWAQQ
ncbi:hypothetical protein SY2F82_72490 [Streptomyces sp. Y2F8-2]|nr:hypothetical protein SY2F82_72490 [Streptomyces sp. Y2F8-2]